MMTVRAPASLTPEQEAAVAADGKRIMLVAPAGSGKTEVLIRRIVRLLSESAGEAHQILAVTYTRKAADHLRVRIAAAISDEAWRVHADTLHGFALDWLRRYGQVVGIGADVVVYSDDTDRLEIIDDYLRSLNYDIDAIELRKLLHTFDDLRTRRQPAAVADKAAAALGIPAIEVYDAYAQRLTEDGGIDFPGMLTKLIEALEVDEWLGRHFRSLYRHVVVDEGQDLSRVQCDLLDRLVLDDVNLFVVADDRQAILAYAGGAFENARDLITRRGEPITLRLHHSFRCSTRILEAAEGVAQQLAKPPPVALALDDAPPGRALARECSSVSEEANVVAEWIDRLLDLGLDPADLADGEDTSVDPEDIAVVGRTRWVLDDVVTELKRRGRQVAMQVEANELLESPEGRIMLDMLALEANPNDKPAARRVSEELAGLDVDQPAGDPLASIAACDVGSLRVIVDAVTAFRETSDLDSMFAEVAGVDSAWADDAVRIVTLWRSYRSETTAQLRTPAGLLRYIARVQQARPSDPGVRVMNIHKVKGLEFRAVAVVSAREGSIPDYREQSNPDGLDAERRSFYVAMTRAKRDLLITWPRHTVDRYGRTHSQVPSRFLRDAGLVGRSDSGRVHD